MNERIENFIKMLEFPEVREVLCKVISTCIENMGLNNQITRAFTRLDLIEEHLGADETYCIIKDLDYERGISDDEREPRTKVPDQFANIVNLVSVPTTEVKMVAGNMTEVRARLLKEHLKTIPRMNGKRFMVSSEVATFLLSNVEDSYKTTESGARKAANDVILKTLEMFPEEVKEGKKKNRGARVIEYVEKIEY